MKHKGDIVCSHYYALFSFMFILHFVYHCLCYVIHVDCLWYVIHVDCLWYVIHVHCLLWYVIHVDCLWYVIHVDCLCYVIHVLFYRLISYICVCKLIAHKQLCSYFIDFFIAISIPQGGFLTKYYDNG